MKQTEVYEDAEAFLAEETRRAAYHRCNQYAQGGPPISTMPPLEEVRKQAQILWKLRINT